MYSDVMNCCSSDVLPTPWSPSIATLWMAGRAGCAGGGGHRSRKWMFRSSCDTLPTLDGVLPALSPPPPLESERVLRLKESPRLTMPFDEVAKLRTTQQSSAARRRSWSSFAETHSCREATERHRHRRQVHRRQGERRHGYSNHRHRTHGDSIGTVTVGVRPVTVGILCHKLGGVTTSA